MKALYLHLAGVELKALYLHLAGESGVVATAPALVGESGVLGTVPAFSRRDWNRGHLTCV